MTRLGYRHGECRVCTRPADPATGYCDSGDKNHRFARRVQPPADWSAALAAAQDRIHGRDPDAHEDDAYARERRAVGALPPYRHPHPRQETP